MTKIKREQPEEAVVNSPEKMGFLLQALYDAEGCSDSLFPKPRNVSRRTIGPTRRSAKSWTQEEVNNLLGELFTKFKRSNNNKAFSHYVGVCELIFFLISAAACLPGRTDIQCLQRWVKVLNPEVVKGAWTKEEDDCIIKQVEIHGAKRWSVIAKFLPGRIGKQCRERWYNHLPLSINRDAWTKEEEQIIAYYQQLYGNKWAEIARFLPGRFAGLNAIKNFWNCTLKGKFDLYSPHGCEVDMHSDVWSGELRTFLVVVEEDGQISDSMVSLNQQTEMEFSDNACSTELTLGFSYKICSEWKSVKVQKRRSTERGASGLINPQIGLVCDDRTVLHSPSSPTPFSFMDVSTSTKSNCVPLTSPSSYSTPPSLLQNASISSGSPGSRLKKLALTFKNTLSIIRRKSSGTDPINFPDVSSSTACSTLSSDKGGANTRDFANGKCGPFSFHHRPQTSAAVKSLGRYLEREFDTEEDSVSDQCGHVISAYASPDVGLGA
ncbi:unnamed protein product [Malus baccata var. baccata]